MGLARKHIDLPQEINVVDLCLVIEYIITLLPKGKEELNKILYIFILKTLAATQET